MLQTASKSLLRTQSDERLAVLAAAGNEVAFAAIVERHSRLLTGACRRVLPEARVEDAVQQAFMAAWAALRRGDDVRELRPWLLRIARNTALNALRVAGYDYDVLRDSLQATEAPPAELERREVIRATLAGLATLPDSQREALLGTAVHGTPHAEIARELGVSEGAVRQLVLRARITLRAAATAIVPVPVVKWLAAVGQQGEPSAARIAELAAGAAPVGAGAAAVLAKTGAVVVIAGGAAVTPALVQRVDRDRAPKAPTVAERADAAYRPAREADATHSDANAPLRQSFVGVGRGGDEDDDAPVARKEREHDDDGDDDRPARRRSGGREREADEDREVARRGGAAPADRDEIDEPAGEGEPSEDAEGVERAVAPDRAAAVAPTAAPAPAVPAAPQPAVVPSEPAETESE